MSERPNNLAGPGRPAARLLNLHLPRRRSARWPVALAALALSAPLLGSAACKIGAAEMPVTMVGSRAVATLGINGTEVRFTVDSGAFYSMLTDAAVVQLQLPLAYAPWGVNRLQGLTGSIEPRKTTVKRLQLLRSELPDVDFLVGGNEPGAGTIGLLGRNLLSMADTEYDLAHGAIRLIVPDADCDGKNMAYWAQNTPVSQLDLHASARDPLPALVAVAQLNGKDIRVLFDTGATSIVSLAAAKRAGVTEAAMTPAGTMRGAGRGEAKAWTADFQTFSIAGETVRNNRLTVGDFELNEFDMLLGIDFFLSHRIYVSKAQQRMYFTYNGGRVFALSTVATTPAESSGVEEPQDAAGFARRGAARTARGDHSRALEDLDKACALAPQVAHHFVQRALIHNALKQPAPARSDLDSALVLDPRQPDARWERAQLRFAAADRAGAFDDLQALDGLLPPEAHQRLAMARLYSRMQRQDQALLQLDRWIAVHRNDSGLESALNSRCWARTLLGIEFDQALADCNRALKGHPKNADFVDSRAWLRLRRGELREALSDYELALTLKPDSAWSLYGRGLVRLRLGDTEPAHADLDAARKQLPDIDAQAGHYGLAAEPDRGKR